MKRRRVKITGIGPVNPNSGSTLGDATLVPTVQSFAGNTFEQRVHYRADVPQRIADPFECHRFHGRGRETTGARPQQAPHASA